MNRYEFDDPEALGVTTAQPQRVQPSWMSVSAGLDFDPPETQGAGGVYGYGPVGPQGAYGVPSTGDNGLDQQLGRVASGFGDRNVPDYTAQESLGYLGQAGANLGELATSSYAGPLGLTDNPLTQELTRPINYAFGGANVVPAIAGNLGARGATHVAQPYIEQLPEGLQTPAEVAVGLVGGALGGGAGIVGQRLAGRAASTVNALDDAATLRTAAGAGEAGRGRFDDAMFPRQNVRGGADLTDDELAAIRNGTGLQPSLERTNKLRAARGLDPLTEEPLAWTKPRGTTPPVPTPDALAELQRRVARDGLTPDNRAIIDDALGVLLKTDAPEAIQTAARPGSEGERIGQAIIKRFDDAQAGVPKSPEIAKIEAIQNSADDAFRGGANASPPRPPAPPEGPFSQPSFGGMEPPKPPAGSWNQRLYDTVKDVLAASPTLKSAIDVSAPGRQLFTMLVRHPTAIKGVLQAQFKALGSAEAYEASQTALRNSANRVYRELAGVELGGITDGLRREENVGSKLAERIPGVTRTGDAYTAAINQGRDWLFNSMLAKMDPADLTEAGLRNGGIDQLKEIGRLVNASTGRGDILKFLSESKIAGTPLLWAPKLLAGRIQLPMMMFSKNPIVRNEAIQQVVSFVTVNTALLGMMKATGAADVELDPRSSDFGQIRIGNRRFDPWAGYKPLANLVARLGVGAYNVATGSDVANMKGINTPAGPGSLYSKSNLDVITSFLRTKLAPVAGEVANQYLGKDITGEDVTRPVANAGGKGVGRLEHAITGLLAPIFLESLAQELGYTVPQGFAKGGIGGAAAEVGKTLASNVPYITGVGGGYYTPSPAERARQGEYADLSPRDQYEALKPEAWRVLTEKAPQNVRPEIRGADTFGAWFDATEREYREKAEARFPNRTRAEYDRLALEAVRKNPIYKAYLNARTHLTDQWVAANPDLAREMDDDMADIPASERSFVPTKRQRAMIGAQ